MEQGGLILAEGRLCSKIRRKLKLKQPTKSRRTQTHTTEPTAARRPGPPRDGVKQNKPDELSQARTLLWTPNVSKSCQHSTLNRLYKPPTDGTQTNHRLP